jgi:hypothetical protein
VSVAGGWPVFFCAGGGRIITGGESRSMKYVWAIVEGIATVGIAYYVFSKVSARFEVIVVALLLMTYVNIRAGLLFWSKAMGKMLMGMTGFQILTLKRLNAEDSEIGRIEREFAELLRTAKDFTPGDIIAIAMGVVDLLCLYHLLTA